VKRKMRRWWRFGYYPGPVLDCSKLTLTGKVGTGSTRSIWFHLFGRFYWLTRGQWTELCLSEQ
jgi:hypothetical protein